MKPKFSTASLAAMAPLGIAALFSTSTAFAANAIKRTGTDLTSSIAGDWTDGLGANGSPLTTDAVNFDSTSPVAGLTVNSDIEWDSMFFNTGNASTLSAMAGNLDITGTGAITLGKTAAGTVIQSIGGTGAKTVSIANEIKLTLGGADAVAVGLNTNRLQISAGTAMTFGAITANGTATANDANVMFRGTAAITVNGTLTIDGQLYKGDAGTLTLNGTNSIGWIFVNNGTLLAGNDDSFGTGTITFGTGGGTATIGSNNATDRSFDNALTFQATSTIFGQTSGGIGALTFDGAVNLGTSVKTITTNANTTFSGNATGVLGGITKLGSATLTLSGANTYSGATNINAGTLAIGSGGTLGTGTVTFNGGTLASSDTGSRIIANSDIDYAVSSTFGTASTGNLKFTGNLRLGGGLKTLTVNNNITEFSGLVSDSGGTNAFTKAGNGTLIFSGTSTYVRPAIVNAGTLQFAKTSAFYGDVVDATNAAKLTVNSGATAAFNVGGAGQFTEANIATLLGVSNGTVGFKSGSRIGLDTTGGDFNHLGDISNTNGGSDVLGLTKLGTNNLTLTGNNSYTGGTNVNAGTLQAGSNTAFGSGAVNVNNGGTLEVKGMSLGNAINLVSGGTVKVDSGAFGTGSVGTITATGGTLDSGTNASQNFNLNGNSTFDTLAGQGTFIGGMVSIVDSHNPGNSPGTQTFEAGLTYADGAHLTVEIAANGLSADLIDVTGGLSIGNNVSLTLNLFGTANYTDSFWDTNRTFDLIITDTRSGNEFLTPTNNLGDGGEGTWTYGWDNNIYKATWTTVPEPSSALLSCLGVLFLLRRRRAA